MENYIEAIIFSIILLGSPGPAIISLLHSGINHGFLKTIPFFTGVILGFTINLLISAFFLFSTFKISPTIFIFFQIVSSLYLIYLTYKIINSTVISKNNDEKLFKIEHGLLLNLLNPKAYVAAFSSFTQFTNKERLLESIITLTLLNLIVAILLQGGWVVLGDKISFLFKNFFWNKIINIFFAITIWIIIILANIKVFL